MTALRPEHMSLKLSPADRAEAGTLFLYMNAPLTPEVLRFQNTENPRQPFTIEAVLATLYGVVPFWYRTDAELQRGLRYVTAAGHITGEGARALGIEIATRDGVYRKWAVCGGRKQHWRITNVIRFLAWLAAHETYQNLPTPVHPGMKPSEFRASLRAMWDVMAVQQVLGAEPDEGVGPR